MVLFHDSGAYQFCLLICTRRHIKQKHFLLDDIADPTVFKKVSPVSKEPLVIMIRKILTPQPRLHTIWQPEEAELFYFWTALFNSGAVRMKQVTKQKSLWALSYVPRMCAEHSGLKELVLSIAASVLLNRTGESASSKYRKNISQHGHQTAIAQISKGIDLLSSPDYREPYSTEYLELLLVMSYYLCIRIQASVGDIATSLSSDAE